MSETHNLPERPNMGQLRTQAKELLKTLPADAKLAQAQFQIARQYGFPSWPKLVDAVETPRLIERMRTLVRKGDGDALDRLLARKPALRGHLDDPVFGFDAPALLQAARHPEAKRLLPVLVRHGADPNARSKWWAGGYGPLDLAPPEVVETLLSLGTRWDVWSAAAHGRADVLESLLDADPSLVSAPGGDGETPLHFAKTAEVAELLIARGADLERRDVDHESTPAQYQIDNPEVLRVLLAHGAAPDPFVAAVLDDVELLRNGAIDARVGDAPFKTTTSNGGHIYVYRLGSGKTPQSVAAERGSRNVLKALKGQNPARDLVAAAWAEDEAAVRRLFHAKPDLTPEDHQALPAAALHGRTETVRLLLLAGLDPLAPGMDSGTALHVAAWAGHLPAVRLLIPHVPLETRDAHHGSTPLGWAAHGAQHCRNPDADYSAIVGALIEAGADVAAPANSVGTSLLDQCGDREDVKAALRSHGGA